MQHSWKIYGLLLAATLVPVKKAPDENLWAYSHDLQESITKAYQSRQRVLVAHGTMFQILAGDTSVPLDRANSMLELTGGNQGSLAGTNARIAGRFYDRIYLIFYLVRP